MQIDVCYLAEIAQVQKGDDEIKSYANLKEYCVSREIGSVLCDTSTKYPRPFVPKELRRAVFDSLAHPGTGASIKLIKSRYFWPNLDKTVKQFCVECVACQQSKVQRHTKSAVQEFDLPSARFQTVHIDIVGPLPLTRNESVHTNIC